MAYRFFKPHTNDPKIGNIIVSILSGSSDGSVQVPDTPISETDLKSYDLDDFINDTYDFFTKYNERNQEFKNFSFRPAHVYETITDSPEYALRYTILERGYATSSQTNQPLSGRRNYRWMPRDVIEDIKNPGYKVIVYEKFYENLIEFTAWSRNYINADKLAGRVEEMLETYSYLFKRKGLIDIRFLGRNKDQFKEFGEILYYGIPLKFYIKTKRIKLVYEKTIEDLAIDVITHSK